MLSDVGIGGLKYFGLPLGLTHYIYYSRLLGVWVQETGNASVIWRFQCYLAALTANILNTCG